MNTELRIPSIVMIWANLKGRKGLRTAKPKTPLEAYIWRMIRFHGGIDTHVPVTADWDLEDYIVQTYFDGVKPKFAAENYCGTDHEVYLYTTFKELKKAYSDKINGRKGIVDQLCIKFNLNPMKAAMLWGKALGYL